MKRNKEMNMKTNRNMDSDMNTKRETEGPGAAEVMEKRTAPESRTDARNGTGTGPEVRIHEDESCFDELEESWKDLAERAGSKLYMSPEWARAWWKHFGRHRKRSLHLISVHEDNRLIALAPFYTGTSTLGPVAADRRLQVIGSGGSPNEQIGYLDDYGISDFLDFIVDTEYEDEMAGLFAELLVKADVHAITLHQAGDDSFIMRKLYPHLQQAGVEVRAEVMDVCPFIDLEGVSSLKDYIQRNDSSNTRRRFRQTLRAIGPDREYTVRSLETEEEIERATDTLIRLHQERWNELGFPGVFHDPRFVNFFREIIRAAHADGRLWFREAVDDQGVCASRMILFYNGRYYDYISGFDAGRPSSKYRPGIGLLLKLVEDAIASGTDRIELLRGEEGYKYDFTDRNFRNWKVTMPGSRRRSALVSMTASLIRLQALLFRLAVREARLLAVQKSKAGLTGMIRGYFRFRWKSVKLKLESGQE